jgi:hypothetical protein
MPARYGGCLIASWTFHASAKRFFKALFFALGIGRHCIAMCVQCVHGRRRGRHWPNPASKII